MAKTPEVHWAEGMFLRPHHLQVGERHREEMLRQEVRRLQPFFWGLLKVDIALYQLENFTFEVRDMEVKLKDGTALSLASNLRLPSRSFKTELDQAGGRMEVWLGVPSWRELDANAFAAGEAAGGQDRRWNVEAVEVLDENTGGNPQVIESRRANGRFFFGRESREGYECVPIALVERAGQGKNTPVLSTEFIPSVTEIGAWPVLESLCQSVTNRLEAKHRFLVSEVLEGKLTTDSEGTTGWQPILKLQILGSFLFLFQQLTRIPRIHPFTVYAEFCRLAGELSIFDDQKSPVKIPLYDHDDLGRCFFEITHVLEMLSEKIVASRYLKVDFMTREELLVANLAPEWLAPESEIYLHVESPLDEKEVKTKLEVLKIGTPADIPILKQRRLFGLDLAMLKRVPSGLPAREDYFYLSIEKDGPYWADVLKDRIIAISGGIDPKLKFSLFIVTKPTKSSPGGATGTASRGPGGSRA
jgi:type VI secretion system protein ImpJ